MKLTLPSSVFIHLIDDNFLLTEDIREKYSWKEKTEVNVYSSVDNFLTELSRTKYPGKRINIVILAISLAQPDRSMTNVLMDKLVDSCPGMEIIMICHKKELEKGLSTFRNGNTIYIANNENTLLRIDNAVKWVIARSDVYNKHIYYKAAVYLLFISLAVSSVYYAFLLFRIT